MRHVSFDKNRLVIKLVNKTYVRNVVVYAAICVVCNMFRVSGVDLLSRIVEMDDYSELQCIGWLRQICQGVAHMHKNNIIHLDIRVSTKLSRYSHFWDDFYRRVTALNDNGIVNQVKGQSHRAQLIKKNVTKKNYKCVSRTDTNQPFAFDITFFGQGFTGFLQGVHGRLKRYVRCLYG